MESTFKFYFNEDRNCEKIIVIFPKERTFNRNTYSKKRTFYKGSQYYNKVHAFSAK